MLSTEDAFPRGGYKPQAVNAERCTKSENLFTSRKRKHEKGTTNKKKKSKTVIREDVPTVVPVIMDTFTYKDIQVDMKLLGCVRNITTLTIEVELPGGNSGRIQLTSISQQYNDFLERKLNTTDNSEIENLGNFNKLFHPGQYLPVIVQQKIEKNKKVELLLSTDPKDINKNFDHVELAKSKLIWAAVESHQEHGYILNAGVKNCRLFLPHENAETEKELCIGVPLWCVVHTKVTTASVSNLVVSTCLKHINKAVDAEKNLHYLIPGAQVNFEIKQVTDCGLKGKIFNNCFAYINKLYYKKTFQLNTQLRQGSVVKARILYIQPLTNVAYLTLKDINVTEKPDIKIGQIYNSQIIYKCAGGVYVKLNKDQSGFVSNKRILKSFNKKSFVRLSDAMKKKYSLGTTHICRVLNFNYMSNIYICTFESDIIKEKFFTVNDIKLGQKIDAKIQTINEKGLIVTFGRLSGFVPNLHLSNILFSENVKTKFSIGNKLTARIWNITDDGNILVTLKQALVDCDLCLTNPKMVFSNEQYPGIVVKCDTNGVLVVFYGNINGFVPKKYIPEAEDDIQSLFYRGQVIMTTIVTYNERGLLLSLFPPKIKNESCLLSGIKGVVTRVNASEGIEIKISEEETFGFIPVSHLGVNMKLNQLLADTYCIGDTIQNLICIAHDERRPIFSVTEYLKLTHFTEVEKNSLVRCYFIKKTQNGILVIVPVLNLKNRIEISNENICDKRRLVDDLTFYPYQAMTAKILDIDYKTNKISLTIKLSEVFDYNCQNSIDYMKQYISDIKRVKLHYTEMDNILGDLNLGDRVECVVDKLKVGGGCFVVLPAYNNVQGVVDTFHCPDNITSGDVLPGVVLWVDFVLKRAEISLKSDIIKAVNKVQDSIVNESITFARLLLIRDYYLLVVLKASCKKQLVVLPMYVHENDFEGLKSYYLKHYSIMDKIKILIDGGHNGIIVGFHNKIKMKFEKGNEKSTKRKQTFLETNPEKSQKKRKLNESKPENNFHHNNNKTQLANGYHDKIKVHSYEENEMEIKNQELCIADESNIEDDASDEKNDMEIKNEGLCNVDESDIEDNVKSENQSQDYIIINQYETSKSKKIAKRSCDGKFTKTIDYKTSSALLSGASNYFALNGSVNSKLEEFSSSDDEDAIKTERIKKKRLSPAEQAEQIRQEEETLLKREKQLADLNMNPNSADDFERLISGNPNSSKLWAQYIAYHLAAAEIEKARGVARKALETIEMRKIDEKFNIWITLLNLENMYGTKETFEAVFEEAVKSNDDLTVFIETIQMLASMSKFNEMEEKIKKMCKKFSSKYEMWIEVMKIYFNNDMISEGRELKNKALKSITSKKKQIDLLVQAALLEFKFADKEHQGEALFENIIASHPHRADVWCTYVDQFIKKRKIHAARRVLERSVCQKLPSMKMKILFKKFLNFEKDYGSKESLQHVKQLATDYVNQG